MNLTGINQPQSLVSRLVRSAVFWMIPLLLITAVTLTSFYRSQTLKLFDDPLEKTITHLIAKSETGDGQFSLSLEPIDPDYQRALSGRYWLVGKYKANGQIDPLLTSTSLSGETLVLPANVKRDIDQEKRAEFRTNAVGPDNEPLRVLAYSVILPEIGTVIIVAAADVREPQNDVRRFALIALGLMLLLSAAVVFAVFWQVRSGLQPLFDLRQRVVDVREGRAEKVDGKYPSEIAPLADELNTLIGHNKDIVERARTHVSNLAHGLKTPLAVLLNESEGSKSKLAEVVSRQAKAMKLQVDHHLQRARAAARGQVVGVTASIEETVIPLARTLERIYRDKDIDFDIQIEKGLLFRGEKRDLEEMAGNLMDNACKWTKSKVRIKAHVSKQDPTQLIFKVCDDGPGIAEDNYGEALKRGARLDEATPGTGFGLPIVDDLAKGYKGDLSLSPSPLGGLCVTLNLPGRK